MVLVGAPCLQNVFTWFKLVHVKRKFWFKCLHDSLPKHEPKRLPSPFHFTLHWYPILSLIEWMLPCPLSSSWHQFPFKEEISWRDLVFYKLALASPIKCPLVQFNHHHIVSSWGPPSLSSSIESLSKNGHMHFTLIECVKGVGLRKACPHRSHRAMCLLMIGSSSHSKWQRVGCGPKGVKVFIGAISTKLYNLNIW